MFLPEHDYEVVADWLNFIFTSSLSLSGTQALDSLDVIKKYFVFADLVGSEKLKNVIVDSFQRDLTIWGLSSLRLSVKDYPSLATCSDIIIEYWAYLIVTGGWMQFINDYGGTSTWSRFIRHIDNAGSLNTLFARVDEVNERKAGGTLINPMERKDCKWHEHISEETKAKCPRRGDESLEVVINGATKGFIDTGMAKTNGHVAIMDDI